MGLSDHRRVVAQFTVAADGRPAPEPVDLPSPDELRPETAMLPGDAFFAHVEQVDVEDAVGRIAVEPITPYPPGAPAVPPGEVITRDGLDAGMQLPTRPTPGWTPRRSSSGRGDWTNCPAARLCV